jgi:hypothetical protein
MSEWPLVDEHDDGIRPAGKPDECFYCNQKIGQPHGRECVMVEKKILIRYTIEIPIMIPHFWTKEQLEFHRNEGSWCKSNLIRELQKYDEEQCLCGVTQAEYVRTIDDTPTREIRIEGEKI